MKTRNHQIFQQKFSIKIVYFCERNFLFLIKTIKDAIERNNGRIINQENSGTEGIGLGDGFELGVAVGDFVCIGEEEGVGFVMA
jgi:hypothetical protein